MAGPVTKTQGKDFNYFKRFTVTNSEFNSTADCQIPFLVIGYTLYNEDNADPVEVSYNGRTIHDELNPTDATKMVTFTNRANSLIWFKLKSGTSAVVSVRAWGK